MVQCGASTLHRGGLSARYRCCAFPAWHGYFTLMSSVLVVSLPRMSMTLTTTLYAPGSAYSYFAESSNLRFLASPVRLPLVVERIVLEVPIHRPVVDHLAPVLDGFPRLLRHVINRDYEVGQLESSVLAPSAWVRPTSTQLEELDVTLLDCFLLQHLTGNLLEGHIHARLGSDLPSGLVQLESKLPAENVSGSFPGGSSTARRLPRLSGDGLHIG